MRDEDLEIPDMAWDDDGNLLHKRTDDGTYLFYPRPGARPLKCRLSDGSRLRVRDMRPMIERLKDEVAADLSVHVDAPRVCPEKT